MKKLNSDGTVASNNAVILGIGCFGHEGATALVKRNTGEVLFAVAEERLNNVKHSWYFPIGSITKACQYAQNNGLAISEVAVNFYEKEFITGTLANELKRIVGDTPAEQILAKLLELHIYGDYYNYNGSFSQKVLDQELASLSLAPEVRSLATARIHWFYNWALKYRQIVLNVGTLFPEIPLYRVPHHLCHATSAFLNSGFDRATVLTIDGQGESETLAVYAADCSGIHKLTSTPWPTSLGIFYLNVTGHLGFSFGDEFKVMGMSAYGSPTYYHLFHDLIDVTPDCRLRFNPSHPYYVLQEATGLYGHFGFGFASDFNKLLKPRRPDEEIRQEHFDFAASIQKVLEEVGVQLARTAMALTGLPDLALAGGVTLNGLMNERIRRESGCQRIFIYPAAADDGTAVGAAQQVSLSLFPNNRSLLPVSIPFFGQESSDEEIEHELKSKGIIYHRPESIHEKIAESLNNEMIVARFTGRSEFGPRALGNRSILASAARKEMKDIINERIKHREPFRPFAPACLAEYASDYFDIDVEAPYMLLIANTKEMAREKIPAVVHADGTARMQTVSKEHNPAFYATIDAYRKLTGLPVIINTSFNINGEAIVDTPEDAIESFLQMDIDFLAIGPFWVARDENRNLAPNLDNKTFLEIRKTRFKKNCNHVLRYLDISSWHFFESSFHTANSGLPDLLTVSRITPDSKPATFNNSLPEFYGPLAPTPATIVNCATAPATWEAIMEFHSELASDEYVRYLNRFYRAGLTRYGKHWHYLDIINVLYAAAILVKPATYLEIGVRRGRSLCTVVRACPTANIVACDIWLKDYAGMENPGPDFVMSEARRHGHQGSLYFIDGDSHQTIPAFFDKYPDTTFDLITVDGDHTEEGAYNDLENVIPHLAPGGVIVFDDVCHPYHPYLIDVWRKAIAGDSSLIAYEFTEFGYGVAFAVKRGYGV